MEHQWQQTHLMHFLNKVYVMHGKDIKHIDFLFNHLYKWIYVTKPVFKKKLMCKNLQWSLFIRNIRITSNHKLGNKHYNITA